MYVDASYEGDLMARLGVPYAVGRESRELYGEAWAGRQPAYRPGKHNFPVTLSPFADDGSLLPFIREPELDERGWPAERLGEGDGGLQAYGFRVCLTDREANRIPFAEPAGYDAGEFELLARYLAAVDVEARDLLGLVPDLLPNGKCDVNSIGPFSLNLLDGSNRAYPDGDARRASACASGTSRTRSASSSTSRTTRRRTSARRSRAGGCAPTSSRTPAAGRTSSTCATRVACSASTCCASRICCDGRRHDDVVALGSYNIDIREVERTWRYLPEYFATPAVFNEGYLSLAVPPYAIPYRSLTPRREDADNLLVPVCLPRHTSRSAPCGWSRR